MATTTAPFFYCYLLICWKNCDSCRSDAPLLIQHRVWCNDSFLMRLVSEEKKLIGNESVGHLQSCSWISIWYWVPCWKQSWNWISTEYGVPCWQYPLSQQDWDCLSCHLAHCRTCKTCMHWHVKFLGSGGDGARSPCCKVLPALGVSIYYTNAHVLDM